MNSINKKWMTGNYYYLNMKHIPSQQKVDKNLEETFSGMQKILTKFEQF